VDNCGSSPLPLVTPLVTPLRPLCVVLKVPIGLASFSVDMANCRARVASAFVLLDGRQALQQSQCSPGGQA
jgi:hypothetical protein